MRSALLLVLLAASPAAALSPKEVVVVFNTAVPASRQLADYYAAKRGVPDANLVGLKLPAGEDISRADYDTLLAGPLRDVLTDRKQAVKCLLTVYGVPLRVGAKTPTAAEKDELDALKTLLAAARTAKDDVETNKLLAREILLSHAESVAAVDSELMCLWWPTYPLARWQPNPNYWQLAADRRAAQPRTLLASRLDGPSPAICRKLVDDALAAEANGLVGNAYVDARGIGFDAKAENGFGYGGYDQSMRDAAKLVEKAGIPVTLDDKPELFAADACPNAALYCGWYSLGNYKPSFTFVPGAVAWHLASSEAVTLRDANAKMWCPNLLKAGVAATLGPVAEPYTVGFPKPAEFFGFLLAGQDTLAEVHGKTQFFVSWMTVLVGDPLYNPFAKTPRLKTADVFASPVGGKVLFR